MNNIQLALASVMLMAQPVLASVEQPFSPMVSVGESCPDWTCSYVIDGDELVRTPDYISYMNAESSVMGVGKALLFKNINQEEFEAQLTKSGLPWKKVEK